MKDDELVKKWVEYEATFKKQAEIINILNKNQQILVKEVDTLKKSTQPVEIKKEEEKKEETKDETK